jgi:hypothetical protein
VEGILGGVDMDKNKRKSFIGRTITGYVLSEDRETITFQFAAGDAITLETEGDCCSYTWIESIDLPDNLLGIVRTVEDIAMPDLGEIPTETVPSPRVVAYYGLKITTDKGSAVIDYRNNSNGYYGGRLV